MSNQPGLSPAAGGLGGLVVELIGGLILVGLFVATEVGDIGIDTK